MIRQCSARSGWRTKERGLEGCWLVVVDPRWDCALGEGRFDVAASARFAQPSLSPRSRAAERSDRADGSIDRRSFRRQPRRSPSRVAVLGGDGQHGPPKRATWPAESPDRAAADPAADCASAAAARFIIARAPPFPAARAGPPDSAASAECYPPVFHRAAIMSGGGRARQDVRGQVPGKAPAAAFS